jgi:hypothetical protein
MHTDAHRWVQKPPRSFTLKFEQSRDKQRRHDWRQPIGVYLCASVVPFLVSFDSTDA